MSSIAPVNPPSLYCRGQHFVDQQGRQVLLHGVNLVNKDPNAGYIGPENAETFAALRSWGFNCVRLGIIWDGLEPQPGVYNQAYLDQIEQQVAWAGENGLYVILDMHQDLYSVLFSDGAPAWATLTGDQPHDELGFVWDDAYFTSPAVQTALDNFWNNAPGPDGIGLQDHYAGIWGKVAERFSASPVVIAYDLMNEPFPGSSAAASQWMIFEKGAELLVQLDGPSAPSADEIAVQWLDPQGRNALLERMRDIPLFVQTIDVTQPVYNTFEQGPLMALYRRVAKSIRSKDDHHILFLESSMGSNMGVYSAVEPLVTAGERDPQQAYAPHGYDLVVDTPYIESASPERVALIFSRHAESAQRHNWPMLVGEWGAYTDLPGTLAAAETVVRQFERWGCSETYWHYSPTFPNIAYFKALWRPYPERIAGTLEQYHFDPQYRRFECHWLEEANIHASTRVFLPVWLADKPPMVRVTPAGSDFTLEPAGIGGAWLVIPPCAESGQRAVIVQG